VKRVATRRARRLAIPVLILLGPTIIALAGLSAVVILAFTPAMDDLPARVEASVRAHHATRVSIEAMPPVLLNALVAIEDERFYRHHGIDTQGLIRALGADLYHRRAIEGGSTLTQQLVKNLYMGGDDDGWRKPENLVLAFKLESRLSKAQILESYLNVVYFGHDAYGIGQAASAYFGLTPDRLDLPRASMLAGLPQAPSYYDLYRNPCAARARQFNVLDQMVRNGYISQDQATAAYNQSIGFPCK